MLHPIVAQMRVSPEQEPAVLARGRDVVVTAGAGTGKTTTLVARYLSLLADGLPLRSVVAITFTRKAAREMRNRVRAAVQRYTDGSDLPPDELRRWQRLYAELDAARIDTIHSLCTEILRTHPAEADVDPRFAVLEEGQAYILRKRALDEALAWAADDPQAVQWFALLGEQGLRKSLDNLLRLRLDVQETLARQPEDVVAYWREQAAKRQHADLAALLTRPEWVESVAALRENEADSSSDPTEIQRRNALATVDGAVGPLEEQLASLSHLHDINLSGGAARAWSRGADQVREVKAALRTLRELWRSADPTRWEFSALDEELGRAFPALRALFGFACARYAAFKRQVNSLDFDDLEQGALELLRRDPAVLAYWQEQVQALLVDEFQDTNGRQRDLLTLLNGGCGRLFMVGDAKQSIYRFRGANVQVFREERQRVLDAGGVVVPLQVSYRAHRELMQGLNDLLRPVLGEAPDPARPWVEPFAALKHHREEPGPGFEPPHIELHLAVGTKSAGALERAAEALVARLMPWVEGGKHQVCQGEGIRPLEYGDIAILCRASTSFPAYEDALERAGVPFLTVAGGGFYERPEIRDLLNALQALADPSDDLSLAGLLRSPALGLSDVDLYRLCQERQRARGASLWDVLQSDKKRLVTPESQRAVRIIRELHGLVGRTSVADLLKAFLDATDYRAALIQAGQSRAARNVSKLLADAHASAIVGVGAFLEYMGGLRDAAAREGEARAPVQGAVQIMSVHQAKGLEFPVVVLGDVSSESHRRDDVLVDPELGILLPRKDPEGTLPTLYQMGKERENDKETAERDRLLYVAATRAREALIFSGCLNLKQGGLCGKLTGWLGRIGAADCLGLQQQQIEYDEAATEALARDLQAGQTRVSCTLYGPEWKGPAAARMVRPPEAVAAVTPPPLLACVVPAAEWADERTTEQERDPPQRVWRVVPAVAHPSAPAWVVGKLVHEALAQWRFPDDRYQEWAEARAHAYGITDARQLDAAVRASSRLLQRFAQHELFQEMDSAERRLHEVPYSIEREGTLENGIIDALCLQNSAWTLVEFKTDHIEDKSRLEQLLRRTDYLAQSQRYADAFERLLGQRPRVLLCLLDYQGQVQVHRDPYPRSF